ncbi:hypothetical protein GCM10028771_01000 [Nocardioides marmoraquaticus]
MAVAVVLVLAVWVTGFFWQRGDISLGTASAPTSGSARPSASASPSAPADDATTPSEPGATLSGSPSRDRQSRDRQGRPKVDRELLAALRDGSLTAPEVDLRVASLNILGSSHTRGPGGRPGQLSGFAPGTRRAGTVLGLLDRERVSLAGLQEVQGDQARVLAGAPGWQMHPDVGGIPAAGQNAVMWRTAEWELVEPGSVAIPYFHGNVKQMPYVLLRHRETGLETYLSTFHNPASTRRVGPQGRWRAEATRRQVGFVRQLATTGRPHLMTGDFNERGSYFCALAGATGVTTPAGGSAGGGCQPPAGALIDWVFGDAAITWSGYDVVRDGVVRSTTDHPMVVAGARIDGADFPDAWGR